MNGERQPVVLGRAELVRVRERTGRSPLAVRAKKARIVLALPWLTESERDAYERRLTRLTSECGCSSGALLGMTALAGYLLVALVGLVPGPWWSVPVFGLIIFVSALAAGKALGLARARARVRMTAAELLALEPHRFSAPPTIEQTPRSPFLEPWKERTGVQAVR